MSKSGISKTFQSIKITFFRILIDSKKKIKDELFFLLILSKNKIMDLNDHSANTMFNNIASISLTDTIPIFQISQSSSEAISNLTQPNNENSLKHHLNIEIENSTHVNKNENFNGSMHIDWSNSLFRPATSFGTSKRRECKVSCLIIVQLLGFIYH